MQAYSVDLRERVVADREAGLPHGRGGCQVSREVPRGCAASCTGTERRGR